MTPDELTSETTKHGPARSAKVFNMGVAAAALGRYSSPFWLR